ncbi:MAG: CRISPR-associated endonuclease Cas2 [Synergistes sp.]|nr:CRISPR-associated endonuclease Cas2 [Synergistes sp.]
MFVIMSYDVGEKRVKKALTTSRKYLMHVHNSVFEGELTRAKLNALEKELSEILKENDGVIFWIFYTRNGMTREYIGKDPEKVDLII